MKKVAALIVSLALILGSASMACAEGNGQGNLYFLPVGVSYDGNDLVIKAVLANIGNVKLENVMAFNLEVYDADGVNIASTSFQNDRFLTNLSLAPGESTYWTLRITGAAGGNIASISTRYNAYFYNVGNATHQSGTLIVVNNQTLKTEVDPFIENGTTLVPLRAIFESLGASVDWDQKTKTVTAERNNTVIKLTIGNDYLTVNGRKVTFGTAAKVVKGHTMVPLRAITESFGGTVAYGKTGEAVTIAIRID